jgi:hypothetical protein
MEIRTETKTVQGQLSFRPGSTTGNTQPDLPPKRGEDLLGDQKSLLFVQSLPPIEDGAKPVIRGELLSQIEFLKNPFD